MADILPIDPANIIEEAPQPVTIAIQEIKEEEMDEEFTAKEP